MPKDKEPPRNVLAFRSNPDITPARGTPAYTSHAIDKHERVTTPDKPEEGSPDWLLGRLMVDHEHHKRVVNEDGNETRAILNDLSTRLSVIEDKLDKVIALAPTDREKAFFKWVITIVVTAILARFGIDAANMPSP